MNINPPTYKPNAAILPNVTIWLEDIATGSEIHSFSTGDIPCASSPTWVLYEFSFLIPVNVSDIRVHVVNNISAALTQGNDLAIDDIEVRLCTPTVDITSSTEIACPGSTITFSGDFENNGAFLEPLAYQWLRSSTPEINENSNWIDIGVNAPILTINNALLSDAGYYRLAISSANTINLENCRAMSEPFHLIIMRCEVYDTVRQTICANEPYNFNGILYNVAGAYNDTLQSVIVTGYDSIVTLVLTVNPLNQRTVDVSVCLDGSYDFNGQLLTASGTYRDTIAGPNCDTVVTLILDLNPLYKKTITKSICHRGSYDFYGRILTTTGIYIDTVAGPDCDTVITLILTANQLNRDLIIKNLCLEESYNFNGKILTATGIYRDTVAGPDCDTAITLILSINSLNQKIIDKSICLNESYNFYGRILTETATYKDTVTGPNCDTAVTLNLTVQECNTICANEWYDFYGTRYNTTGIYTKTVQTAAGLDSIITLSLTVKPLYERTIDTTICVNESYEFFGKIYTETGIHKDTLAGPNCDTVVILNLTVLGLLHTEITENICLGDSILFAGKYLHNTGIYKDTLPSVLFACDSIVTLTLTAAHLPVQTNLNGTGCIGECYQQHGFDYTPYSTGTYNLEQQLQTVYGCDSTVILSLYVRQCYVYDTVYKTMCANESYDFYGTLYNVTGTYTDTLYTPMVDSVITLILTVNPLNQRTVNATICTGESFDFYGRILMTADTYKDTIAGEGCDSIITLNLRVQQCVTCQYQGTLLYKEDFGGNSGTVPLRAPDPGWQSSGRTTYKYETRSNYLLPDVGHYALLTHTNATSWSHNFEDHTSPSDPNHGYFLTFDATTSDGQFYQFDIDNLCDGKILTFSIYLMNINPTTYDPNAILPNVTIWLEDIATGNNIYSFSTGDIPCTASPTWELYKFAFLIPVNVSILRVHIINNINTVITQGNDLAIDDIEVRMCTPTVEVTSEDTVCIGSPATFTGIFENNGTFSEPLAYQWLKSATPEIDESSNWINIGNDSPILTINNILISDSGYYRLAVSSANTIDNESCRAMSEPIYMAVKLCRVYDTLYQTICANEPYNFNGILYNVTDTYNDTIQIAEEVDSIITLILTVNPLNQRTIDTTICVNENYDFHGRILTETGTYKDTIAGMDCDSIIILNLIVRQCITCEHQSTLLYKEDFGGNSGIVPPRAPDPGWQSSGRTTYQYETRSDYLLPAVGHYALLTHTNATSWSHNFGDHTSPSDPDHGYFLTFGATANSGQFYQFDINNLCDGKILTFSIHLMNINPPTYNPNAILPNVTIRLEDIATGNHIHYFSTGDIPCTASPTWALYEFAFLNPVNVSNIRVHIINNVNTVLTQGNDLAIDDIEVGMCTPTVEVIFEDTVCIGSPTTFNGIFENNGAFVEPLAYQWLKSATPETDESSNWINIGNDSPVLTIDNVLISDSGYYRLAISSANTIDNESCRAMSEPVYMAVKLCRVYDTLYQTICANEPYDFNGTLYDTAGTYNDTLQTATDLDSIITLILTINPLNERTISATICSNESYDFYGDIIATTGIYQDTIAGAECDTAVTLILTVNPSNERTITTTICVDESYDFYGDILTTTGIYQHTIAGAECDSIITLILTVNPFNERTITTTICVDESYDFYGDILTTTGTYQDTIAGAECDSIITLILTVNPLNEKTITTTICANESYDFYGDIIATTGTYQDTIAGAECDTAVTLHLTVLSLSYTEITEEICWGDSILFAGKYFHNTGMYNDTLSNVLGCDSLVSLQLQVPEIAVKIHSSNFNFCDTYEIVLTAISPNNNIQWSTGDIGHEITVTSPDTYTVTASEQDCELSKSARITIEPCPILIVFPNAITPSKADGINEYFYLPSTDNIAELSITIYNRWGNAVFFSNDLHFRWDGKINGQITPDIYSYVCSLLTIDGERRYMKGVVVVL
jgi:gliding motility-associated-like protein